MLALLESDFYTSEHINMKMTLPKNKKNAGKTSCKQEIQVKLISTNGVLIAKPPKRVVLNNQKKLLTNNPNKKLATA